MDILATLTALRLEDAKKSAARRPASTLSRPWPAPLRPFDAGRTDSGNLHAPSRQAFLIAECKKASPSKGVMIESYDPVALAGLYRSGGAGMLSILTEPRKFLGDISHLEAVRRNCPLPILRKDFIADPWHIAEAWAAGADAILLIAAALEPERMRDLADCARTYGLSVLAEIHSEKELEAALSASPEAVGVNARNLADFSVDPGLHDRLISLIPQTVCAVAESGIKDPETVERLACAGYRAFLVGESFVTSDSPGQKTRTFSDAADTGARRRNRAGSSPGGSGSPDDGSSGISGRSRISGRSSSRKPRIKICGITNEADALLAARLGADELGFIFAPSPRRIEPVTAARIIMSLRDTLGPWVPRTVGVFVNENPQVTADILSLADIDCAQIHGDEGPEDCRDFDFPWYRALRIPNAGQGLPDGIQENLDTLPCSRILLDTGAPGQYGGTGIPMDNTAGIAAAALVRKAGKELWVAGGIRPENVGSLLDLYNPDGIDVGSGTEARPGKKSAAKLAELFSRAGRFTLSESDTRIRQPASPSIRHENRYYGEFGGRYIPEVLRPAFEELEAAWDAARLDPAFGRELARLRGDFIGRPTPLCEARRLSELFGHQVYLKLEGLAHTGAHKINNALGQGLLAQRMGKRRIIAETGAGQHGLATAAVCAKLGLECEIFMGEYDMARQHPNVYGMRMYGATVTPVREGNRTLTDAVNAALKNWTERVEDTHYLLGSALGPYPYPDMVRTFQSVIGTETKEQLLLATGRLPDRIYACVGGGSNSIGIFSAFLGESVELVGVEAGGRGDEPGSHAIRMQAALPGGRVGVVQGYKSIFLQDESGSLVPTSSISAGLDYAGIGPELAHLGMTGRIRFTSARDQETLEAVATLARLEGVLPALESAHAVAAFLREAPSMKPGSLVVLNISGRGDKDLFIAAPHFDREDWLHFLESEVERIKGMPDPERSAP